MQWVGASMSLFAAAVLSQALGLGQTPWWQRNNECRQDPDSFECFCENASQHRVCRGDIHYLDLDEEDQSWVCLRFPDYRWCPDPNEGYEPDYGYFSAVVDYASPQWRLDLYVTAYEYEAEDLAECVVNVITHRGSFPLNREIVFESRNPFVLFRNQFGEAPLGTPRYVERLRVECRVAGSGTVITETLEAPPGDPSVQRWTTLR